MATAIMNTLGGKMIISKDKLGTVCWIDLFYICDNITKLPESGVLCGNITEFGVEGGPPPPQTK